MSDWTEATDPVPERRKRERTPAEIERNRRLLKRRAHLPNKLTKDSVPIFVDPDFEDMGF